MKYIKHITRALLLMIAVQLPLCAADVESSITNDISGIATNVIELAVMSAKGLLWCGQKALGLTRDLTDFTKKHPVIACTLGLSAYAAWRLMKYKYGNRIYCRLNPVSTYYCCPSCGHVAGSAFNDSYSYSYSS